MAALAPPPNGFGVPVPPAPANPASLVDITNARQYTDHLVTSKGEALVLSPPKLT